MLLEIKKRIYKIAYKIYVFLSIPPKVNGMETTIKKIYMDRYSISRYGDGEFSLIFGNSLPFQDYNEKLAKKLLQILNSNQKKHLVGIPNVFGNLDDFNEKSKNFWNDYLLGNRKKIYGVLDKRKVFYDAQITRIYINRKDKHKSFFYLSELKKIWDGKRILIVEGEFTRFGVGNDILDNCLKISRILVPSKNAFDKYNEIFEAIVKISSTQNVDLILLAIGPTATCLAFDLCKKNIQAIDIGNLDMEYEWMKRSVNEQIAIEGKYTHEAYNGDEKIIDINDKKYENEIVLVISK